MTTDEFEAIVADGMSVVDQHSLILVLFVAGAEAFGNCQFGTGSLVRVPQGVALVTAGHVLEGFQEMGSQGRLQLGSNCYVIRPSAHRIIRISKKPDLGVLILSNQEVTELGAPVLEPDQVVGRQVSRYELIGFCGFPGATKELIGDRLMSCKKYRLVGTVDTVEPDQFSIRRDKERYESPWPWGDGDHYPLGGISGAPVFSFVTGWPHMQRRRRPALIGWVYEGHSWSSTEAKIYAVKAADLWTVLPEALIA